MDRIDMHLTVSRVDFDELTSPKEDSVSSAVVRTKVTTARRRQWRRFAERPTVTCNAGMRLPDIRAFCELDETQAVSSAAPSTASP